MLTVLFILGALSRLNFAADIPIKLLSPETDGVVAGRFPNSFLLKLPDCSIYGNKSAQVLYIELPSNASKTESFEVPYCPVSLPGYLLKDLKSGTTYNVMYKIENDTSTVLTETTTTVTDYQQINAGLPARSGAMVVITVILSLAMVALLVGLIFSLFFTG
ncbi:uroplakin-2 [Pimephales promelas]|uniref:uroplakin-2 n=1 Tax=Pimephales promelas TaxID=90988 RepID=UPI0019556139|nr:uroplakin-2 [Pimephales promelas]KAG1957411.1 uroplakin-2 [Pimephales promelas]